MKGRGRKLAWILGLLALAGVEGDRGSRKIRRAYDPAPEEKPAPANSGEETEVA